MATFTLALIELRLAGITRAELISLPRDSGMCKCGSAGNGLNSGAIPSVALNSRVGFALFLRPPEATPDPPACLRASGHWPKVEEHESLTATNVMFNHPNMQA